jgi:SH3 domain-containing YSC84-like protein 1
MTKILPMTWKRPFLAIAVLSAISLSASAADSKAALDQRLDNAKNVINEIMQTPDKGIPDGIMRKATCVAVVPSLKKGAFIVGAEYGQGVVTCRTAHGWSAPAFIRMAGGSFGFQAGGQGTDLVLIAVNNKGMQDLLKDKFKIGGDAAATAGPVGRDAQASTDLKLSAELLTYSRSKGLLAGIDLDGTSVSQNGNATDTFYGSSHPFNQILTGNVPTPSGADAFVQTIARYSNVSLQSQR